MRKEGASEEEIKKKLIEKKEKSVEKYGNKSKIGLLLDMQNAQLINQNKLLKTDHFLRKVKQQNVSNYNKAQIQHNELSRLRN
mmetsp:Transcript_18688/g.28620  ORF Transcript_18688/g.28620 Transcript_18688/m.28620 type:complete len:83 (+) Transcript_18688:1648-1896(+)